MLDVTTDVDDSSYPDCPKEVEGCENISVLTMVECRRRKGQRKTQERNIGI